MSSTWIDVALADNVKPGEYTVMQIEEKMIVIFNLDQKFYAIEDVCTHDGSQISSGSIVNGCIECPRHGARFDIRTGAVTAPPAYEAIQTFPVQVVNGVIQVRR